MKIGILKQDYNGRVHSIYEKKTKGNSEDGGDKVLNTPTTLINKKIDRERERTLREFLLCQRIISQLVERSLILP